MSDKGKKQSGGKKPAAGAGKAIRPRAAAADAAPVAAVEEVRGPELRAALQETLQRGRAPGPDEGIRL